MATTSTVPTVRAQLVALLSARPALADVQIGYTHPGDALEHESMFLGDSRATVELATIRAGRRTRQESYVLDVWIEVNSDGPTAQPATERAYTLLGELEGQLADDASLGLSQPFWAHLAEVDNSNYFDDTKRGFVSRIRAGIQCEARLT